MKFSFDIVDSPVCVSLGVFEKIRIYSKHLGNEGHVGDIKLPHAALLDVVFLFHMIVVIG